MSSRTARATGPVSNTGYGGALPLISEIRRQILVLHNKFQASQDYIVRPYLKEKEKGQKEKKKKKKTQNFGIISISASLLRTGKGDSLAEATSQNLPRTNQGNFTILEANRSLRAANQGRFSWILPIKGWHCWSPLTPFGISKSRQPETSSSHHSGRKPQS